MRKRTPNAPQGIELKSHIDKGKRPYPCPSVSICGEKTNCGGELPVELISIAFLLNLW
jgi:hypothetical protein